MRILAITGSFGSGKTTVTYLAAAALRSVGKGVKIIALDEVSRIVLNESLVLRHELADAFGGHILNDDSSLNRAALAQCAFATDQTTAKLNALVHPPMIDYARELLLEAKNHGEIALIESPFPMMYFPELFEGFEVEPLIWTVVADKEMRLMRGIADGYSKDDALQRMDKQPCTSAYQAEADEAIENSDGLDDLRLEVGICFEKYGFAGLS